MVNEKEAKEYLEFHKKGLHTGGLNDLCTDKAIQALTNQEMIIKLLKCHDDYDFSTAQLNYELVKAIRKILEVE